MLCLLRTDDKNTRAKDLSLQDCDSQLFCLLLFLFGIIAFSLMAFVQILIMFSMLLVLMKADAQTTHPSIIPAGSSLSPSLPANMSWRSPSGLFAFGFYPQGSGFAVGIWMVDQLENIIIWTANRDDPLVSSNATLKLTGGGLLLRSEQAEEKNITDRISGPVSSAAMLNAGNFVLLNDSDQAVWQSFDSPTDTILAGQRLLANHKLVSSTTASDHSSGRFSIVMQGDGNLVSYLTNISHMPEIAY